MLHVHIMDMYWILHITCMCIRSTYYMCILLVWVLILVNGYIFYVSYSTLLAYFIFHITCIFHISRYTYIACFILHTCFYVSHRIFHISHFTFQISYFHISNCIFSYCMYTSYRRSQRNLSL